jgi:anti-sigma factor RsiW
MNCSAIRPYLQAFVDDELSPERAIDVELHLNDCAECACEAELTSSLAFATRVSVGEVAMCPEFRARLCQCMSDERKRQESPRLSPLSWRVITPLAAAAGLTLFFSYGYGRVNRQAAHNLDSASSQVTAASSQDNLVDMLVQHHAARQVPDLSESTTVVNMEPQLGFPVRAPDFERFGAKFEGATLFRVNGHTAGMLRYNLGGRRVSLYLYNPDEVPLRGQRALQPRVVGDRAIFVGSRRGYSIATCEQQGVGYAVAGDLSGDESAELVAAVYH